MPASSYNDELIPPAELLPPYARAGDFKKAGTAFLRTAVEHGLRPDHRILDLGCGVGRFAAALAGYLEGGGYKGIDVSAEAIEICERWIGSKTPGFEFSRVDLLNLKYNPAAAAEAAEYRFDLEEESFDFVFSNSLFTHMVPSDTENYVLEIGRLLRPGGRTLNTFFLLNEESVASLEAGRSRHDLSHPFAGGVARVKDLERPEAVIAYDERFIRDLHAKAGLRIDDPIRYGGWSGRELSGPGFGNKDIVAATKLESTG